MVYTAMLTFDNFNDFWELYSSSAREMCVLVRVVDFGVNITFKPWVQIVNKYVA